jgi:single-strand DNA-binding protein
MSKSVNKVILLGNVGKDPEVKSTRGNTIVVNFSIATSYKQKEKEEVTEWHNITAFGRTAEIVRDYVKKGSKLYVEGRLQTQTWEKDGQKHYKTVIIVEDLALLSSSDSSRDNSRRSDPPEQEISDDEIPF